MATPIWLTGFEYGLATPSANGGGLCDVVTGTCAIGTGYSRSDSGDYGLRCQATATTFGYISKGISGSPTTLVGRFYFRTVTALPAADVIIFSITTTGHKVQFTYKTSDQKLYVGIDGATTTASASVLVVDTWYYIDYKIDVSANPWVTDWQIDGVAQTQDSYAHDAETISNVDIGVGNTLVSSRYINYDDVILSVTSGDYPIGPGGTIGLRPNADGTHNNAANILENSAGTDIDGTTAWNLLDEKPWTSTATSDYVRQTNNGSANYCEIQFADIGDVLTFTGVSALLEYASAGDSANTGGCIVRDSDDGETTLWGAPGALADYSETSAFYKNVIVTPPAGGWTKAYVNSLRSRFGYSDDADPDPYWLAIMLEVAYNIPSASILQTNAAVSIEDKDTINYLRMTNAAVSIEDKDTINYLRMTNAAVMIEYVINIPTIEFGPKIWMM